jgi:hypothetical protein
MIRLLQDGQIYSTDVATFRQWLAEGRIKADAQIDVGSGWQPIMHFSDARPFLLTASQAQSTPTTSTPKASHKGWLAAAGLGIAGVVGATLLLTELLKSEPKNKTAKERTKRRLFLSFDYDDKAQVDGFRLLTYNKNVELEFIDGSLRQAVDSENKYYIRQRILEQMHGTSVCICLIGKNTWKSDWVDWEVRTCAEEKKGILGIHLKDRNGRVPQALSDLGAKAITWEPHTFADAIEEAATLAGR